ncbi:MAG TPA: DUF177 domain-containing protein [Pyrinomonadaceae bacterium]
MRIELEKLEDGKGRFAKAYQPEELDLVDERITLNAPVDVAGSVRRSGAEVVVNGRLSSRASVECDRCLKAVELPISAEFSVDYITGEDYESSQVAELTADDLDVSVFDGETIDVDELVKEQLLLSVPDRTLCREDCKGICSSCGADLNAGACNCKQIEIDPRWEALKKLKNDG